MISKAQIKRDIAAITHVLEQFRTLPTGKGGWISVADLYLRAGEGLSPALKQMRETNLIETRVFGEYNYLRLICH